MPIPALVAAGIAAAPGIIKGIKGISQRRKAKKLKAEDFDYLPPALRENLAGQRNIARSARLPGQSQAEANIRQQAAGARNLAGQGSLADKIAAAQGIQAQSQEAIGNLATQGAAFQAQEQNELQDMMNQQAAYQEAGQRNFENTKLGLMDAGTQNIFGGVSDVGSAAIGALGVQDLSGGGGLFGGNKNQGSPLKYTTGQIDQQAKAAQQGLLQQNPWSAQSQPNMSPINLTPTQQMRMNQANRNYSSPFQSQINPYSTTPLQSQINAFTQYQNG